MRRFRYENRIKDGRWYNTSEVLKNRFSSEKPVFQKMFDCKINIMRMISDVENIGIHLFLISDRLKISIVRSKIYFSEVFVDSAWILNARPENCFECIGL